MAHQILLPAMALVLLTFAVWAYMYVLRLRFLFGNRISPQRISTPEQMNALVPEHINWPSNNLKNLFEMPVIFYFLCIAVAIALPNGDAALVLLAWAYVAFRAIHSAIQCTVNYVPLRFVAYSASSFVLAAMAARFSIQLL